MFYYNLTANEYELADTDDQVDPNDANDDVIEETEADNFDFDSESDDKTKLNQVRY